MTRIENIVSNAADFRSAQILSGPDYAEVGYLVGVYIDMA